MMIKRIVLSLMLVTGLSLSLSANCYEEWHNSYKDANKRLALDLARCTKSSWPSRCSYEAKLNFGLAVEIAGENYHDCLGY